MQVSFRCLSNYSRFELNFVVVKMPINRWLLYKKIRPVGESIVNYGGNNRIPKRGI